MHPLPLVILLTLAADPDRTIPVGCREDFATCREDCTIDYGGSTSKYRLLTQCMERCSHEQSECTTRHYSLRDANLDSMPQRERDPAMREPSHDDDLRDSDNVKPASSTAKPPDGVRRGVYRASEGEPAAQTESAEMKEPVKMKDPEPEPEPEPAPAPKPSPAAQSKRAPAAAKDDEIRIFDDPEPEPAPAPKAAAPKPSEPLRPKPPAEPKKKDISDWDPNGK
ncbi:hypothetical protein [Archangium sp.]|uniref:hypothetical protein n=1 Tax=Archangium sp. TaxID=1872627 RepID=UPI00389B3576